MTERVPLGSIADVRLGKMLDRAKHRSGRLLPYLRNVNVRWGRVDTGDLLEMPFEDDELDRFSLREGDVLVCEGGEPGRAAIWDGSLPEVKYQKALHRVRFRVPYDPRLLVYQLELLAKSGGLDRQFTGSTIKHFTGEAFKQLPVPLLAVEHQSAIVEEIETQFSRLDAAVAALKRAQANLKRYRAAVLKAACEGRLVPTEAELARREGRSYETGAELLGRVLEERRRSWNGRGKYVEPAGPETVGLPEVPEGWVWATLDQLQVLLRNGIAVKPDAEDGLRILRINAVRPLAVSLNDIRFLNATSADYPAYVIAEGDLLFTRYNGSPELVGVCGRVPVMSFECVHPDKLIRCKVASSVNSAFVAMVVNVGQSRDYLARRVRTTAGQAGISGGDLKRMPIPIPPAAEQERIVAEVERRLSAVEAAEKAVEAGLRRAARLRQAVLARAFSGEG